MKHKISESYNAPWFKSLIIYLCHEIIKCSKNQ